MIAVNILRFDPCPCSLNDNIGPWGFIAMNIVDD